MILYELLAGELPFQGEPQAILVQILREEPRPPRQIRDTIPRDLETICLKAMAKEPAARYATAGHMADDLRRFLNGQAVLARPVGWVGRLWRWRRRNPAAASLATALIVALSLGLAAVTWQWRVADFERRRAEANLQQAHRAIQDFIALARHSSLRDNSFRPLKREWYTICLNYYRRIRAQRQDDPELLAETAVAQGAAAALDLEFTRAGGPEEQKAFAELHDALRKWRGLTEAFPAELEYQGNLGIVAYHLGDEYVARDRHDQALPLYRVARGRFLGLLTSETMRPGLRWRRIHEDPVSWNRRFLFNTNIRLARSYSASGREQGARRTYREAAENFERLSARYAGDPRFLDMTAELWRHCGVCDKRLGEFGSALAAWEREADWLRKLHALEPRTMERQQDCLARRIPLAAQQEQLSANPEIASRVMREYDELVREQPLPPETQETFAMAVYKAGCGYFYEGRHREALEYFRRACTALDELRPEDGASTRRLLQRSSLAVQKLASCEEQLGLPEAEVSCRRAVELCNRLIELEPDDPEHRQRLGACRHLLGDLRRGVGDLAGAAEAFRSAILVREALLEEEPENPVYCNDAHWSRQLYGETLARLGRREEAIRECGAAVAHLVQLVTIEPEMAKHRRRLAERRAYLEALREANQVSAAATSE